jgi:hypothetical protein
MKALSVIRFAIFGAVGLGFRWAAARLFNVGLVSITSPMAQPGTGEPPGWYL